MPRKHHATQGVEIEVFVPDDDLYHITSLADPISGPQCDPYSCVVFQTS